MVSLKIQLLTSILLISEAYSQLAGCGGSVAGCGSQRCGGCGTCGSATPSVIPCGQFIVPAIIKPLIPTCQPEASVACGTQKQSYCDEDDDSDLDKLLYLLIRNIIETKKGSGKKQSSYFDSTAGLSGCGGDGYDASACGYGDDYDYCSCPAVYSSGYNSGGGSNDGYNCPEISVYIKPACQSSD